MTISNSSKLKRSNDRKVANAVSKNGKTPTIANTFGLPVGKNFYVLVQRLSVKVFATLANWKKYTRE